MKRPKVTAAFRWQYFLPRLVVITALWSAIHFGLDPLLRWSLITTGEAVLGARVEVADLHTSIYGGEIAITELAAASPSKPMRNLAEAAELHLNVDARQLLRKRVVIHDGAIRGLRFDSARTTSGALEKQPESTEPSALDPIIAAAGDKALAWFDNLSGRLEDDLTASLATPKLLDDLEKRWPKQYEALKGRADKLSAKSKDIEATFRELKRNPLRNLDKLNQLQTELEGTQKDLATTLAEIKTLPDQAKADRKAIDAARKQDEQFLKDHLKPGAIDAGELNRYLLGDTASDYLTQTTYWIEQARKFVPKKKIAPPARSRGTNVFFEARKQPTCLIERVELAGDASLNGALLTFAGELTDAASQPELHDQPLRLCLHGSGAFSGELLVELDRRADTPHDLLKIDVPQMPMNARALGNAEKLAVTLTPGEASFKADVHLDGDELSGLIEFHQSSRLTANTPALHDDRIAQVLQQSLSGVDRFEATVRLAGTLKRPDVKIDSNVGPQLAGSMSTAVRAYLTERKDRLVAKVQGRIDEQMSKLDAQREKAQQELLGKLGENQQLISQVASLMGGSGGKPSLESLGIPQLGKNLSLDKFKR
jgi:uncharacterized protein (TIGR03545 family)